MRYVIFLNFILDLVYNSKPWMADPFHPHYLAGQKALEEVYGCKPDLTREGGSIPITLTFQVGLLITIYFCCF